MWFDIFESAPPPDLFVVIWPEEFDCEVTLAVSLFEFDVLLAGILVVTTFVFLISFLCGTSSSRQRMRR